MIPLRHWFSAMVTLCVTEKHTRNSTATADPTPLLRGPNPPPIFSGFPRKVAEITDTSRTAILSPVLACVIVTKGRMRRRDPAERYAVRDAAPARPVLLPTAQVVGGSLLPNASFRLLLHLLVAADG